MSRNYVSLLLLLVAPTMFCASAGGSSMSAGPMIATVNYNAMINPKDPKSSALKQWSAKVDSLQKELDKKSKEIDQLKSKIDKKAEEFQKSSKDGKLTDAQNQELLSMYTDLQTKAQNIQMESHEAYVKAGEELKKDIERATDVVAAKGPYTDVLDKQVVIWSRNSKDITQDVIRELNSSYDKKQAAERAKGPKTATS